MEEESAGGEIKTFTLAILNMNGLAYTWVEISSSYLEMQAWSSREQSELEIQIENHQCIYHV